MAIEPSAAPGAKVYWGANGNGVISEAELDGTGGGTVDVGSETVTQPTGTALDTATAVGSLEATGGDGGGDGTA